MSRGGSLALLPRTKKGLVLFWTAIFMLSMALQYAAATLPKAALAAGPVVTLEDGINGCQGVRPTPGSENTNKRLIGGSLEPGGTATFEISFPVTAADVGGDFRITDCVFIDGTAALKYSVDFVPNNENFILTFTLQIPAGTPNGAEYCNYAKTTASPSKSPASNRKAGPACFIVGGNISVFKVNADGDPLAGATFHIVCTLPTTNASMPATVIDGVSHASVSGGVITQDVTTGADGHIAIQAPEGTSCVITETDPPDGYDLPADASVTLVATAGGVSHTFIDPKTVPPAPSLSIVKSVSLSADGPWSDSVTTTTGTTVYYHITVTNTGNVDLTAVTLSDDKTADLVAAGCTIPTTLAVGAHFDCDYSNSAAEGTTTNTATADSEETGPKSDTATVIATTPPPPVPDLSIVKSVSLSADGPWTDSVTTTTGTTVYYHITVTNTGEVDLTSVTLSDDKTADLVAAGCTIPTTLAVGAHFDCDYSNSAAEGTTTNTATADSEETGPKSDTATVVATTPVPGLSVVKSVSLSADGPWVDHLTVQTGTTVYYLITVTNTGEVDLTEVTLSDDKTADLVAAGCTIPTTLAIGASFDCAYSNSAVTGTTTNTATADSKESGPDSDTATVVATPAPPPPTLTIDKTNDAPLVTVTTTTGSVQVKAAKEGATVTFTLGYVSNGQPVTNAKITDVIPVGLTYVAGSATSDATFTFAGYDATTRTLTWNAATLSGSGKLTYKATVDTGASGKPQPLENVATIVSDNTDKDSDVSDVFVPAPVKAATSVPTAPRTDIAGSDGTTVPGGSLGLMLLLLAGLAFAIVFVTPVPASIRDRARRR
jgi:uncharacterized repeat protein (TIGR01451 family)